MNKYTKGPWGIMKGDHGPIIFSGECGRGVAMLARQVTTSERDANALLISAAPELLEALTMGAEINTPDLMDWIADRLVFVHKENPNIDFVKSLRNRAATARAAIAKAKGEQT